MGTSIQQKRRLAAILAADLVGYSRMMELDEAGTVARVRACRRDVVDPAVRRHNGRIVKTTGDGILIEFASAVDGVACAAEIQRVMLEQEADNPLVFRIGVNVGDVIIEGGDIYGDGVNIAARLENLAEPGGVLISRSVRDQIRGTFPHAFEAQGEHHVKNLSRPVQTFLLGSSQIAKMSLPNVAARPANHSAVRRWLAPLAIGFTLAVAAVSITAVLVREPDAVPATATAASEKKPAMSIVVLPFLNASGDADKDAFAESLTEDLITDLSRINGSFVIASNTTFTYRNMEVDPRQVAQELGVRYVLTGSMRRVDDDIRITAALIDGDSGAQIWAERFDRTRGDFSGLQEEVTGRVARALNLRLNDAISQSTMLADPADLDADDYALRAWAEIWNKPQSKETNERGLAFASKALSLDPRNAQALATASYAHARASSSRWSEDPVASLRMSIDMAEQAVALNPGDADSQYVLSFALRLAGDRIRGEEANRLCLELNPNHAPGHGGLGIYALQDGRLEEATAHFEQALALSPRDPLRAIWYNFLATIALVSDHFDRAVEIANRGLAANPEYMATNLTLAAALTKLGRQDAAAAALAHLRSKQPALLSVPTATRRIFQAPSSRAQPYLEKYTRYLTDAGVGE